MKKLILLGLAVGFCSLLFISCKSASRRPDLTSEEMVVTAPSTPPPASTPAPHR